ncbi:MAG TPA: hypothetical protein DCX07_06510, partial [Phycisphaerales bacterium]|nr:hypothetical protein [Phycisphaerales bacterium]
MNNRKPTDLVSGRLNGARRADGPSRANYGRDRLGIAPESEQAPPPPAAPAKANAPSLEEILQGTAPTSHHADRLEFRAAGDGPSPFRPKPAPPVRARPAPAAPRRQPPQGPKIRRGVWVAAIAGALLIILLAWILSPDRELAPSPAQAGAMTRQIAPAPADPQTDEQARESSADAQPAFDRWAASHAIEDAWSS